MADKDVRELKKALKKQGFVVRETKNGHYQVFGKDGAFVTVLPGTPSDHRSLKNSMAYLKRAGFIPNLKKKAKTKR
ncbi:hypothetical protein GCM10020000_87630 [Streptomyces olivoverticillatus]